jgi:starch phosphorylase
LKFAMNGALTIGTLDGANVELRDEVGPENFFLFGLTAGEIDDLRRSGYDPGAWCANDPELASVIELIRSGFFSRGDPELFAPLLYGLLNYDPYFVFADFAAYVACQRRVGATFRDRALWTRMSILNAARTGKFSSDRTIREYCREIWRVQAVPIQRLQSEHHEFDELTLVRSIRAPLSNGSIALSPDSGPP